jgi:hypothetical protein
VSLLSSKLSQVQEGNLVQKEIRNYQKLRTIAYSDVGQGQTLFLSMVEVN